ncbi:DUF5330 domain-containing protein [Jiella sp. MQZ9-1]|uniref:DUF5330 domain-containing protein n=1 Tax=Jiella flava TaxID=2816857 RepID=A0A939JWK5_9HYPH|nr:DUF5330 domain-containing protein [Jiella flava]MBO0662406.1 DUF5330 domain-containing protein [Jiella flava]MCD2471630.1 DUF5330 domain-containing protein [Jiella flava]
MIRFVIKCAFFLGLIAMFVPGGRGEDDHPVNLFALLYGAQAAVSDLSNFCARAPSACAAGRDVARFAGDRIKDGMALAYNFADDAMNRRREANPAVPAASPAPAAAAAVETKPEQRIAKLHPDTMTTAAIPAIALPSNPGAPSTMLAAERLSPTAARIHNLPTAAGRPLPNARHAETRVERRFASNIPIPQPAPRY